MPQTIAKFESCDPVWAEVRNEALRVAGKEPMLASFIHASVLNHERLEDALSFHLANKLACPEMPTMLVREIFDEALEKEPEIATSMRADLMAVLERDPACHDLLTPFLYFKGFHALQSHRVSHHLWTTGRESLALFFQSRISVEFQVDVHPAARIGKGVMIDHATGVVIGETCVIENNVSMLHGVTLGGNGKEDGDRHPKIREGALLSVGAQVLGNIEIGRNSRVGAGSVVLKSVPAGCTAAGVPAKIVGCAGSEHPAQEMHHEWAEDSER